MVTIWEVALSIVLPLVQETVVAGPPVELQVRVNTGVLAFSSEFNWNLMQGNIHKLFAALLTLMVWLE